MAASCVRDGMTVCSSDKHSKADRIRGSIGATQSGRCKSASRSKSRKRPSVITFSLHRLCQLADRVLLVANWKQPIFTESRLNNENTLPRNAADDIDFYLRHAGIGGRFRLSKNASPHRHISQRRRVYKNRPAAVINIFYANDDALAQFALGRPHIMQDMTLWTNRQAQALVAVEQSLPHIFRALLTTSQKSAATQDAHTR